MSNKTCRNTVYRSKRVQRLKKLIILMLITAVLVPNVLCVILFVQLRVLEQEMREMETQLSRIQEKSAIQENAGQKQTVQIYPDGLPEYAPPPESLAESEEAGAEEAFYKHKVYLTFDDGPSKNTGDILDILENYGVKATFFVVGKEDEHSKEMLKRIVDEGHTLGMHSYSHVYREIYSSPEAFAADFEKLRQYLYDITGVECSHYRFPGGSSNTVSNIEMKTFIDYLTQEGVIFHDWNVSSGDAASKLPDVDTIVGNCTRDILNRETSVVLLHDAADKSVTVEALPAIIESIQAMEDTVILPVTEDMTPVQHVHAD